MNKVPFLNTCNPPYNELSPVSSDGLTSSKASVGKMTVYRRGKFFTRVAENTTIPTSKYRNTAFSRVESEVEIKI